MKKPQWMIMANAMGIGVKTYNETSVTKANPDYQGDEGKVYYRIAKCRLVEIPKKKRKVKP